jgi:alpha-D-xyloside xylohydrolase
VKALTGDGQCLVAQVSVAGEGVIRVRLAPDQQTRTRSARAITLVRPARYEQARVALQPGRVALDAGPVRAELDLGWVRSSPLRQARAAVVMGNYDAFSAG